jgi:cholesterol oxidase
MEAMDYDVVIVGSGFGGSVSALRLTEKGYRVAVLEAGRRFDESNLPKTSWRLNKFLWAPRIGLKGLQRIHILRDVVVLAGAGVGGGSLIYANTLYVPPKKFFDDPAWSHITDWADELAPYYDQASRMLGVVTNPTMTPADEVMKAVADEMGVGHTFSLTPVGVFFGDGPGVTSPDPYFGGVGPERTGCVQRGECMTGCRHNAKNTLPKNYLGLAEQAGARVYPLTEVTAVKPMSGGGYVVETEKTGVLPKRGRQSFTAGQVVVAAGTYNTQRLLHRMKEEGFLHRLSPSLGRLSRTNSESLLGAISKSRANKFNTGVAITSSFYPEPNTHIEPVRYGKGSNSMGMLATMMTDEEPGVPRWKTWLKKVKSDPKGVAQFYIGLRGWSEKGIIALCMQPVDNSITVYGKRGRFGRWRMTSKQGEGEPNPSWLPKANEAVRTAADLIDGVPAGNIGELVNAPMTAHFVGGATISDDSEQGVIDPYHRVWGYEGLHVVDGSAVTANLGVNPSLTITAQAERAMAMWPNKSEPDARPVQGEPYRQVTPVPPEHPVVPDGAPGTLNLPLIDLRASGREVTK